MGETLTQSEYARRIGSSRQYIRDQIHHGHIVLTSSGLVDVDQADNALISKASPGADAPTVKRIKEIRAGDVEYNLDGMSLEQLKAFASALENRANGEDVRAPAPAGNTLKDSIDLNGRMLAAKTEHLEQKARLAKMQADEAAGELVRTDEVSLAVWDIVRALRSNIQRIPARVAPVVVGMTDLKKITATMESEIDQALEDLSRAVDSLGYSADQPPGYLEDLDGEVEP